MCVCVWILVTVYPPRHFLRRRLTAGLLPESVYSLLPPASVRAVLLSVLSYELIIADMLQTVNDFVILLLICLYIILYIIAYTYYI